MVNGRISLSCHNPDASASCPPTSGFHYLGFTVASSCPDSQSPKDNIRPVSLYKVDLCCKTPSGGQAISLLPRLCIYHCCYRSCFRSWLCFHSSLLFTSLDTSSGICSTSLVPDLGFVFFPDSFITPRIPHTCSTSPDLNLLPDFILVLSLVSVFYWPSTDTLGPLPPPIQDYSKDCDPGIKYTSQGLWKKTKECLRFHTLG